MPCSFEKARILRNRETPAEKLLWERLKENRLDGFRFKRQHPVAHYIVDIYCHRARLAIELDGEYHHEEEQRAYDERRAEFIEGLNLHVLRFSNEEVFEKIDEVIDRIRERLV